jgi:phospholipase C
VSILTSLRRFRFVAFAITLCLAGAGFLAPAETGARADALRPAQNTLRAFSQHPRAAARSPIRHVVVVYLENQSFDSLLGFWCDRNPGRCPDGGMPSLVTLSNGAVVRPSVGPDVVPVVDHGVGSQERAMNCTPFGTCQMNGWQNIRGGTCDAATGYQCIAGYEPSQEPDLAALAARFAIGDMFFSMVQNWSWIAHLWAVAATSDGFTGLSMSRNTSGRGWGCDSRKLTTWSRNGTTEEKVPSCVPDPALRGPGGGRLANGGAFQPTPVRYVPTIMDELNSAGLSWHIYGGTCSHEKVNAEGLKTCTSGPFGYYWSICPTFAECLYAQPGGLVSSKHFVSDASSGRLPAFTILTPPNGADSWHNGFSVTSSDNWLGEQVAALMHGPDWRSTAMFVTWDDCGCFYDQASPGFNADGSRQGPRAPLLIVSPYAKPGYTDTTPATFASILAYTEQTFGLSPLTVNDASAYPFSNAFNYHQAPLTAVRMVTRPVPKSDHIVWSQALEDS